MQEAGVEIRKRSKGLNRGITPKELIKQQLAKGLTKFTLTGFDVALAEIIFKPCFCQKTTGVFHAKITIDTKDGRTIKFEILSNSIYLEVVQSSSPRPILTFASQEEICKTEYDISEEAVKIMWDEGNYLWISKLGVKVRYPKMTAEA